MASAGRIQAAARGLLQYLRMVGTGVEPVDMSAEVVGTVDLRDHYGVESLRRVVQTATPVAPGTRASAFVPAGQHWRLRAISGAVIIDNVGDQFMLAVGVSLNGIQLVRLANSPVFTSLTVNDVFSCPIWLGDGIIVPGGTEIFVRAETAVVGANPATLSIACLFHQMPNT